jgi:hypothetical protein
MISILAEAQDVFVANPAVTDLFASFGQPSMDDSVVIKIKKNRRKHLKEFHRL